MSTPRITELLETYISGISTYLSNLTGISTYTSNISSKINGYTESSTGFLTNITTDHNYIHQGKAFSLSFSATNIAAGSDYKIGFTTPTVLSGKYIHFRPAEFSSSANSAQYKLYEGSVFSEGTKIQPNNRNRNSSNVSASEFYTNATAALTGIVAVNAEAGGNFANQPGGGKITFVSDNDVEDKLISITTYGTITGATTTVTSETKQLNGTTDVDTTTTTWQNVLGFELSGPATGTITIKNAAAATIITISPAGTGAGVVAPATTNARDQIVRHDASGASTAPVGIIGTAPGGAALSSVDALNGTTEENHNSDIFATVTKVLIGAVASTVDVKILYPEKILSQFSAGSGGVTARSGGSRGSENEYVLTPATNYVVYLKNSGSVTATDIEGDLFWYEKNYGA